MIFLNKLKYNLNKSYIKKRKKYYKIIKIFYIKRSI